LIVWRVHKWITRVFGGDEMKVIKIVSLPTSAIGVMPVKRNSIFNKRDRSTYDTILSGDGGRTAGSMPKKYNW